MDKVIVETPHKTKKSSLKTAEISLENEFLKVIIAPQLGGKITSIESKISGNEFLTQNKKSSRLENRLKYGMEFLPPFSFGFDECFPTISPCKVYENDIEVSYPDHGELWTKNWSYSNTEHSCLLKTTGVHGNYAFTKEISLQLNNILIVYNLTNTGKTGFKYIWSSHPLLQVDVDDEIILPNGVKEVQVYYSSDSDLKKGEKVKWPATLGGEVFLNKVQEKSLGIAAKLFSENMIVGKAALYRKKSDQSIVFNFDTNQVNHLGIWMCYGGWPENKGIKDYTVALEPTVANTDSLSEAIVDGGSKKIEPGASNNWFTKISIEQGVVEI